MPSFFYVYAFIFIAFIYAIVHYVYVDMGNLIKLLYFVLSLRRSQRKRYRTDARKNRVSKERRSTTRQHC